MALRSIQRAADIGKAGDTILIWPGLYRESIFLRRGGELGKPLVIRGAIPGKAIISGEAEPSTTNSWSWLSEGPNRWKTRARWRVDGLRSNGVDLYKSSSLNHLNQICKRDYAWPAFFSTSRSVHVCLPARRDPRLIRWSVRRQMPMRTRAGGHQVATLWIEAPYVKVTDLVFDFGVMAGIQLWKTHHVSITNNVFLSHDVAVNAAPSLSQPDNILIEKNYSSCSPLYEWRRNEWLSWQEVYPYSNCSLAWLSGSNVVIRSNHLYQVGDGIKLSPVSGMNSISGNLIQEATDDAIELDGPGRNVNVTNNKILDAFVGISMSPLRDGPVLIEGNFIGSALNRWPPMKGAALKLMSGPTRNAVIKENTLVADSLDFTSTSAPLTDVVFRDNRVLVRVSRRYSALFPERSASDGNKIYAVSRVKSKKVVNPKLLNRSGWLSRQMHAPGPSWLHSRTQLYEHQSYTSLHRY